MRAIAALAPTADIESPKLSFLPYQPSPMAPIPWSSIRTGYGSPLYRVRRVASWAAKPVGRREFEHRDELIEMNSLLVLRNSEDGGDGLLRDPTAFNEYVAKTAACFEDSASSRQLTTLT